MTDFADRTSDAYLTDHNEYTARKEINTEDTVSKKNDLSSSSSSSSFGSWSIDNSIEVIQTMHKPLFDELPTFSLKCASPSGRSLSPIEPISLFNLSISPISSIEDLTRVNEQSICSTNIDTAHCGFFTKEDSDFDDDNERISLEEIIAQNNTPPVLSRSNKRLNLETIFEDVFLETPKKRRFNGFKRFNSWRIEITNDDRISSYVFEQQQNRDDENPQSETTSVLCNAFDDKINLNT